MLNDLKGYCDYLKLIPVQANENGLFYKCVIHEKIFTLQRKQEIFILHILDDTVFNAFVAVLQSKYKSLVTCRRNVDLLGPAKNYNLIKFKCAKASKVKSILGNFENVYFDMLKEINEKVGKNNE